MGKKIKFDLEHYKNKDLADLIEDLEGILEDDNLTSTSMLTSAKGILPLIKEKVTELEEEKVDIEEKLEEKESEESMIVPRKEIRNLCFAGKPGHFQDY